MASNNAIVVLIGNNGTLISKHNGNQITSEFFTNITEENKGAISNIFAKDKKSPIYVLLDTTEQTYKRKSFPNIRKSDVERIAKRELLSEGDVNSLRDLIIIKKSASKNKKSANRNQYECLFVSSFKSQNIDNWLSFLYELPNRLVGIYMLPIETINLVKKILTTKVDKATNKKPKNDSIYCLIIETKVGGIRQIVFSNSSIVFTRAVSYNFDDSNFIEKYSQDIYSTFEYLKRIYIDMTSQDFEVINILPEKTISEINKINSEEINIKNYSTQDTIKSLKLKTDSHSDYSDLIISSVFTNSKKILTFYTQKIKLYKSALLWQRFCHIFNFLLLGITTALILAFFITNKSIYDKIDKVEEGRLNALKNFSRVKKMSLQDNFQEIDKENNFEKIFDMGRIEEALGGFEQNFVSLYSELTFLNKSSVTINSFEYKINNFESKKRNINNQKQITINGKVINKNGDIEDLFTEFDKVVADAKSNMNKHEVKTNELPRNIDFNQKYFEFPLELTIISKNEDNQN